MMGLLLGGLATGVAHAGKPSSGPVLLEGTGGYAETAIFGSSDALTAVKGESAVNPAASGSTSMADAQSLSLVRGIEVDAAGDVYAIFHAGDASSTSTFTGIVRHDGGSGVDVLLANAWDFEGTGTDSGEGAFIWAMDLVPTQDASASGPLEAGDLVVSRWIDDDTTATLTDGRHEIVLFRLNSSGALVEQQVLRAFTGVEDLAGGRLAADCFGNVYMWLQGQVDTGGELSSGLYRFSYDANSDDYATEESMDASVDTATAFEVDDDGNLYVQGAKGGADAGVVFQLAAGDDPSTDFSEYAMFTEDGSNESFNTWSFDNGTFSIAMSDLNGGDQDYVGLVEPDLDVAYADRIADTAPRAVIALSADDAGSVYVIHEDKTKVSKNQWATDGYTIYRLDVDTSGGGGGKGNGKGKKK